MHLCNQLWNSQVVGLLTYLLVVGIYCTAQTSRRKGKILPWLLPTRLGKYKGMWGKWERGGEEAGEAALGGRGKPASWEGEAQGFQHKDQVQSVQVPAHKHLGGQGVH